MINGEVQKYIEANILPLYERNDWAHQLWHIKGVIKRSLSLSKKFSVNPTMIYVIASFHDIGCSIDRNRHEKIAGDILMKDSFLQEHFTKEEMLIMKEAAEDHRGSTDHEPRSIYGKIIATADRFVKIDDIVRSMHYYTLEFYSSASWKEMVAIDYAYLNKKYGKKGYAKTYINHPKYDVFLKKVSYYLSHPSLFEKKVRKIDKKIREEKKIPSL